MSAFPWTRWPALPLLLLLPLASQAASWQRVSSDTLKLSGAIDEGSLAEYTAVAQGGYRHLLLDSPGGLPSVALARQTTRLPFRIHHESTGKMTAARIRKLR